jgi:hypothetical protein
VSLKDLFNDIEHIGMTNTSSHPQIQAFNDEVESSNYALAVTKEKNRFVPNIDFSKPENFAKYGSAEEYYTKAIQEIYNYYPYDGSLKEKEEWYTNSTYMEKYLFDNEYPRTNGYALISADGWGTQVDRDGDYGLPSVLEYISFKSGPHQKNIWDESKDREENLKFDIINKGVTVEFWLKKDAWATGLTNKEVVFDLWNSKHSNEHDYGRLRIELSGTSPGAAFRVTALSGTSGVYDAPVGESVTPAVVADGKWSHYAFTLTHNSGQTSIEMYRNGAYVDTVLTGSRTGHVTGSLYGYIGANTTPPRYTLAATGSGKLSGSIDDFRYWKTRRTSKEIGRNYISQVGGGTNTDDANTDLGVYFKFNEGMTTNTTTDSIVLDYSGRLSNGTWIGYDSYSRSTGSAMVLAGATKFEFKDPIIYSSHPDVVSLLASKKEIGEIHDISNVSSLYKSFPSWITEEDEAAGSELKNLTQIMASYFDELHNQIENLPRIKDKTYPSGSTLTGSFKPYPFSKRLLSSQGFKIPELFVDSTILENFSSRDEAIKYEEKIYNVKNLIYKNIYNNLDAIYKSKGTVKSIRNLIRAFGANEDIISVNVYANNIESEIKKNIDYKTIRKRIVNFNKAGRNGGTIYSYMTGSGTTSLISGSGADGTYIPSTVECEVIFPKPIDEFNPTHYLYENLTASIFGQHTIDPSLAENDLTWNADDVCSFQVFAVKTDKDSNDAFFMLTGSNFSPVTSSMYRNVYQNEKWNFAVRFRPSSSFGNLVYDKSGLDYKIELYGVKQLAGTIEEEFLVTSSMSITSGQSFATSGKRVYAGAERQNFTGSLITPTNLKISNVKFWLSYISDEEVRNHAVGMYSYGPDSPYKNSVYDQTALSNIELPKLETLALDWNFKTVSSSADTSGQIVVNDYSSGSSDLVNRYGFVGNITKQNHTALIDHVGTSETNVVLHDFIFTTRNKLPEQFNSSDMVKIDNNDDLIFTKDTRPVDYFFSIENSMYRVISEEILNVFSSVVDFNNLIGDPVNRYRQEYKQINKLRHLFFERVENEPDVERYLDYFKHVDAFIQTMLEYLIPASSNISDSVLNIVESHVLERNKYQNKFPTMESKQPDPITTIQGINELLYNWKFGHAPVSTSYTPGVYPHLEGSEQNVNCTYWHELAERGGSVITSGDATVDAQRETIKTVVNTEVSGSTYATRKLGKNYRFATNLSNKINGGSNIETNNLFGFHRQAISFNNPNDYIKINLSNIEQNKNCDEDKIPEELRKRTSKVKATTFTLGESSARADYGDGKANLLLPFTIFSSSVQTGYLGSLATPASESFENIHRDVVGRNNQRPLQGPFTEKYVGGLQYRHAPINYSSSARTLDSPTTRAEGWFLKTPTPPGSSATLLSESFSATDPVGWTNVGSTATGPSGWILTHSGPTPSSGTGPDVAFDGSFYAYAETSTPNHPGSYFGLVTPKLDASDLAGPDFSASFYYHMYGIDVGNLRVQHSEDSSFGTGVTDLTVTWNGVPATYIAGQQQGASLDPWRQATIDLTSYAGTEFYLRFLYQGGITYLSDVAIDAIEVSGTSGGSVFKLLDPAYNNADRMRAVYYRDEVAKRPVNIRNIKMTSSSPTIIGNYSNNYEVVNIPGRNINNIWFVQNSGSVATSSPESDFISGSFDFSLADRNTLQDGSKNKTVIVERFSAPGGPEVMSRGFLDVESETFSVYNSMNYRNSTVRNNLNLWNKQHSIWGGYDGIYGSPTASYHKVQRNTGLRIEWEGGVALTGSEAIMNTITASYFDNGFITHQIPQSDSGYSWISSSIIQSVI